MHFVLNWKKGLLWAGIFVVVGIGFFATIGSKIDVACQPIGYGVGCHVWHAIQTVVNGYADFWLQFFAPRCVGGNGPDDCIGPAIGIMFWTLAASGFIISGTSRRKKESQTSPKTIPPA